MEPKPEVTVDWSSLILCFTLAQHVGLTLFTDALLMLWEGRCSAESPGQGVHPKLHTIQKLYTMYGIGYHLRCRRASWMDLRPQLLLLPLGKQPYWAYRHTATRGQPSPWSPLLVRDEALLAHSRPERHAAAVANSPLFQCFSPSSASTLFNPVKGQEGQIIILLSINNNQDINSKIYIFYIYYFPVQSFTRLTRKHRW